MAKLIDFIQNLQYFQCLKYGNPRQKHLKIQELMSSMIPSARPKVSPIAIVSILISKWFCFARFSIMGDGRTDRRTYRRTDGWHVWKWSPSGRLSGSISGTDVISWPVRRNIISNLLFDVRTAWQEGCISCY